MSKPARSVIVTDIESNRSKRYKSMTSAARSLRISTSHLSHLLKGRGGTVYQGMRIDFEFKINGDSIASKMSQRPEEQRTLFTAKFFKGGLVVIEPKNEIEKFVDKAVSFTSADEIPEELRKITEGL